MLAVLAMGCGARTGLTLTLADASPDIPDAATVPDVPPDTAPVDVPCPGETPTVPSVVTVAPGVQLALAPGWSTPRTAPDALTLDAPADGVAALVLNMAAENTFERDAFGFVGIVHGATGAAPGNAGRYYTPGPWRAWTTIIRGSSRQPVDALRDAIADNAVGARLVSTAAPYDTPRGFVVTATVVRRTDAPRTAVLVAVAPEDRYDDSTLGTYARVAGLTDATGVAPAGYTLGAVCTDATPTSQGAPADVLWLVDTSYDMAPDEDRVGATAERVFRTLTGAGVTLRMGVFEAGSVAASLDLDQPGFAWIPSTDPDGARHTAYAVTFGRYRNDLADTLVPYPMAGNREEPLAAGVIVTEAMARRAGTDETDARNFRAGAARIAVLATNAAGTGDDAFFFGLDGARWGWTYTDRVLGVSRWYADQGLLPIGMTYSFLNGRCPTRENFIPCLAALDGGAVIPLGTATDGEVDAAIARMLSAAAVAGGVYPVAPPAISSTLSVRVGGRPIAASRLDGFDYDPASHSVLLHGPALTTHGGARVRASYFTWRGP